MTGQLTFDLPLVQGWQRDAFLVTPATSAALAAVDNWKTWAGGRLLLIGPHGSGKTHLAHILADMAQALWVDAAALQSRLPDIAPDACVIWTMPTLWQTARKRRCFTCTTASPPKVACC